MIILCYFSVKTFTSAHINSIGDLYDLVLAAQGRHSVDGNFSGALLTMNSKSGIYFGIIHTLA
jgi:hypothetical protein